MAGKKENVQIKYVDLYAFCTRNFPDKPFWEENSDLKRYEPYKTLIEKEGESKSADIMDVIWMVYDNKSTAKKLQDNNSAEERDLKEQAAFVIFGDKNFPWDKYDWVIDPFKKHVLTPSEEAALFYRSKMDIFRDHINKLTVETAPSEIADLMDQYDKMLSKFQKQIDLVSKERLSKGSYRKGTVLHWVEVF